ncbi:MAG: cation:proton antiporter [Pseudomonadota bacterium]
MIFEINSFLDLCVQLALVILSVSFIIIIARIIIGPTLPDRVLALDVLVTVGIGYIAVIGISSEYYLYVDIAIALGLVGFLATVALARFILTRGAPQGEIAPSLEPAKRSDNPQDASEDTNP